VCAMGMIAASCLLPARPAPVQAAVYLLYFRATGEENRVVLRWETAQEVDNVGFNLYRAEVPQFNEREKLNEGLIPSKAFGEMFGASYSYPDTEVVKGVTYYYWLESIDTHSVGEFYSYDAESATPGASPSPTSTSTPTETATSSPTATDTATPTAAATSTPTMLPTTTPTTVPTATPSFTATRVPTSTPTSTPTITPVSPPPASPISMSVAEQRLSPTATFVGMEGTPTPASITVAGGAETFRTSTAAGDQNSEPGAPGWPSFRVHWPTIPPGAALLFISLISLLGALLFTVVLALVRELNL
jgi:hypothetical protein